MLSRARALGALLASLVDVARGECVAWALLLSLLASAASAQQREQQQRVYVRDAGRASRERSCARRWSDRT